MKKWLKTITGDIKRGENIDVYIMFFAALAFALLGFIGKISSDILSAGILGTLGVLAISTLTTRHTIQELSAALRNFRQSGGACLEDRSAFIPFRDFISDKQTVWMFGPSLIGVFPPNSDFLQDKIRSGSEIRLLLFNPESQYAPNLAAILGVRPQRLVTDINSTLEIAREMAHFGLGSGKLEVRFTEIVPGYSMIITDPEREYSQMVVEFNGHNTHMRNLPHVTLDATENRRWYAVYMEQFQALWDGAKVFDFK
jgi:hypothetical protein